MGIAFLFISHDIGRRGMIFAIRVAVMYLGKIVEFADREDALPGAQTPLHGSPFSRHPHHGTGEIRQPPENQR